jgi:hypothetical protein
MQQLLAAEVTNKFRFNKEDVANKSTAVDLGNTSPSDDLYPSQSAVKTYVDAIARLVLLPLKRLITMSLVLIILFCVIAARVLLHSVYQMLALL